MLFHNCHIGPSNPCESYSYAQYGVQANPPSNSDLPMAALFEEGTLITLTDTKISLQAGYLYLIDFIFLATTEVNSYMQITPKINDSLRLLYSVSAPSGTSSRNASASGSFTIPVSEDSTTLSFNLTYPETVRNIDISGAVSVSVLNKINQNNCC